MKTYIVITGATGFLGSEVVKLLISEKKPLIFIGRAKGGTCLKTRVLSEHTGREDFLNNECLFIEKNLDSLDIGYNISQYKISKILHCAANLSFKEKDRGKVLHENFTYTKNICELAKVTSAPLYFVSTAFVHGNRLGELNETELLYPEKWNNAYEESKFLCEEYIKKSGIDYLIFRPGILISESITDGNFGFYVLMKSMIRLKKDICDKLGLDFDKELQIPIPFLFSKECKMDFITREYVAQIIHWALSGKHPLLDTARVIQISSDYFCVGDILRQLLEASKIRVPLVPTTSSIAKFYIKMIYALSRIITPIRSFGNKLNTYSFYVTQLYIHNSSLPELRSKYEDTPKYILNKNIFYNITKNYIKNKY